MPSETPPPTPIGPEHLVQYQFKPGNRVNAGRHHIIDPEIKKLLIEHSIIAANTLCDIVRNRKTFPDARLRAAIALLDRVHGKAKRPIGAEACGRIEVQLEGMLKEWAK